MSLTNHVANKIVVGSNLTILLFGPTGCLSGETPVNIRHGNHTRSLTMKELFHKFKGESLRGRNWNTALPTKIMSYKNDILLGRNIADVLYSGPRETYTITVEGHQAIRATADHRFLTPSGYERLEMLSVGDHVIVQDKNPVFKHKKTIKPHRQTVKAHFHPYAKQKNNLYGELTFYRAVVEAYINDLCLEDFLYIINNDESAAAQLEYLDSTLVVHHLNENPSDNRLSNLKVMTKVDHDALHGEKNFKNWGLYNVTTARVQSIEYFGLEDTYDISMEDQEAPNFVVNGVVVHNSGKTAQIGELAEYYYKTQHKRTRLYSADRGGWETIKPYVNLGIIEAIPMFGDPFVWIDHVVKGEKFENGKWIPGIDPDIALYAFEGMTSMADAEMSWMADASSKGVNIGGGGSFSFNVKGANGENLKIGSNNMAHYSVAQQQVFEKSTQSQYLPGTVLWTAGDRRGEDDANGGVVGPQTAGKAQAGEVPRWFKYTFRIGVEVLPGQAAKHVLYTDRHVEMQSKGLAQGISNSRVPLSGTDVAIPSKIEPASLVQVLQLLDKRQSAAEDEIRKRLGL